MKITQYTVTTKKIKERLSLACVSDLHGRDPKKVIATLEHMNPDLILLAGDIFEVANRYMIKRNEYAMAFLEAIKGIAPVFYCFGNHEIYYTHSANENYCLPDTKMQREYVDRICALGIHLVNNSFETICVKNNPVHIGGLVCGYDTDRNIVFDGPDLSVVKQLDNCDDFKILICHYPHYYEKHLKNTGLDLIVSGHAHGGHWRIFNRGIYAPHQGLFPKYTSGMHDGRFIINRGAVNNSKPIPRFFNPTEIVEIILENTPGKTC